MATKECYKTPAAEIFEAGCETNLLLETSSFIESGQDNEWGNY